MSRWCALKVRVDCPECGSAVLADGPYKKVLCTACGNRVQLTNAWKHLVTNALSVGARGRGFKLGSVEGVDGTEGLGTIFVAMNRGQPPICSACDEVLDEVDEGVADGTSGEFHCPACGSAHPTWPAPGHLKKARVQQVFMAPPESAQQAAKAKAAQANAKPIMFACPNCGANLKITGDTKRICTCAFCDVDSYLPAELWNQLHPVRRRRAFWLRCS